MKKEKLTVAAQQELKGKRKETEMTVLVRPKAPSITEEELRSALQWQAGERMVSRRGQLLQNLEKRYGRGQEYCQNFQAAQLEAQSPIAQRVSRTKSLWLAGMVAVRATREEIEALTEDDSVETVDANPQFELPEILSTPLESAPTVVDGSAWGVDRVGATSVWGGYGRGNGILVGHLDTGVDAAHPALAGKVSAFEEFDSVGNPLGTAPHDSGTHGTHTAGTICGRNYRGINLGVAPGARLASALVLPGGGGTFAQIVAGMQWAIDQGAHVINMSLGGSGYYEGWNLPVLNSVLSGVPVVASVGNSGLGTSGGPGNDYFAIGVGATHFNDVVSGFSSGQTMLNVPFFDIRLTYMKPDISAPGVDVISCVPGPGLAVYSGTSMAAPHVAGALALLMSAAADLQFDPFTLRSILLGAGREDFGESGRDQRFGFGRLDTQAAVATAISLA